MDKDVRTAFYWATGYMLASVLLTAVVGAFVVLA